MAHAAYEGMEIDTLISIGPPYRTDMELQYKALRLRTRRWLTIHAQERDWLVEGGGRIPLTFSSYPPIFDADARETVPGIAHSNILYRPEFFHLWEDRGWLDKLKDWR